MPIFCCAMAFLCFLGLVSSDKTQCVCFTVAMIAFIAVAFLWRLIFGPIGG